MSGPTLNPDFFDLLEALEHEGVRYLVVGAFALAGLGASRFTSDLDVWVCPDADNAQRVIQALRRFGAPILGHGVGPQDFARPGTVYQMGLPPRRIDILTRIDGVEFDQAWRGRAEIRLGTLRVPALGLECFLRNKRASGRPKDLLDIELLREAGLPVD